VADVEDVINFLYPIDGYYSRIADITDLLRSLEPRATAPDWFMDGELQRRFDDAHGQAVNVATRLLETQLTIGLPDPDEDAAPELGWLRGLPAHGLPVASTTAAAVNASLLPDARQASLHASELMRPVVDPAGAELWHQLRQGWQLVVPESRGLHAVVDDLLKSLDQIMGIRYSSLCVGLNSSLGALPTISDFPRLVLQLAGRRTVQLHHEEREPASIRVVSGRVLYVPAGYQLINMPLDLETMHLEVTLHGLQARQVATDRSAMAMVRPWPYAQGAADRSVASSDPAEGWPMRLVAPGGVQVVAVDDGWYTLAIAGQRLDVSATGAELVLALAAGEFVLPAKLGGQHVVDPTVAVAFAEQLWRQCLVEAKPPVDEMSSDGGRLSQVASASLDGEDLVSTVLNEVDPAGWRTATAGEVHQSHDVVVDVQPVQHDGAVAQIAEIAASMNAQFFGLDTWGMVDHDPALVVRVRPAKSTENVLSDAEAAGSSEVAPPFGTRKVTFVCALNEADGGWIQMAAGSPVAESAAEAISAWVAMRSWSLGSIVGERLFLLGRLHGPPFR